ncbi:hypothetical protein TGRUB_235590 [Toxoplasma gondii RUB]|uniref:Secreted protein n=9 Tax=Toxoplasma gondii TaxID=5811 RepID=B9PW72_TOXGV|nr:hypothetical protein TGGT1_235590 [Toxoplasma gondii GT1]ESS30902.1 hypothetical protein TGVEG_235590 [Toxoplasma gondii VEG]KAF4640266.1 hypothetical protein TGRH88_041910 [Toxoplasma gondii]KFG34907.1 hypothetical protein TGFOU_235590 [Toxoplasma gondii FOU]KFG37198.1 hypothetical protein TGP89_235590 [Toxoplasma gondii p89]KFG62481.1 hypothetical protein TGRUB_235590 [Toxoplasma gondii RUB]KFH02174.1 hypothetical protein TGMAS_235590 [Toxoplasma gondii MAS]PUA85056.1 hypothetical prote
MAFRREGLSIFVLHVFCIVVTAHFQDASGDTVANHLIPDAGHEPYSSRKSLDESIDASDQISALIRHAISNLWTVIFPSWPNRGEATFDHSVQEKAEGEARRLATEGRASPEVCAAGMQWALTCKSTHTAAAYDGCTIGG